MKKFTLIGQNFAAYVAVSTFALSFVGLFALPGTAAAQNNASPGTPGLTTGSAVWGWTDAAGRKNYSDVPPPQSVPDSKIFQRPKQFEKDLGVNSANAVASGVGGTVPDTKNTTGNAPKPGSTTNGGAGGGTTGGKPSADQPQASGQQTAQQKEFLTKQREVEEKNRRIAQENCANAQQHLAALQSGARIGKIEVGGQRGFMSDEQKNQEIAKAQNRIATDCAAARG